MRHVRSSRPASARSFFTLRLNLIGWCFLTGSLPLSAMASNFIPSTAIGSVPSLSGYAIAYRWRSLPRIRRQRVSSPQGSSSNECCLFRYHHGPFFVRLSFPTPTTRIRRSRVKDINTTSQEQKSPTSNAGNATLCDGRYASGEGEGNGARQSKV